MRKGPKKKRKRIRPRAFARKLHEALDLPLEIAPHVSKVTMLGQQDLLVENHRGVLQCGKEQVRLLTNDGVLGVQGKALELRELSDSRAYVRGEIESIVCKA